MELIFFGEESIRRAVKAHSYKFAQNFLEGKPWSSFFRIYFIFSIYLLLSQGFQEGDFLVRQIMSPPASRKEKVDDTNPIGFLWAVIDLNDHMEVIYLNY